MCRKLSNAAWAPTMMTSRREGGVLRGVQLAHGQEPFPPQRDLQNHSHGTILDGLLVKAPAGVTLFIQSESTLLFEERTANGRGNVKVHVVTSPASLEHPRSEDNVRMLYVAIADP